jgi:pre-mRNA-splicing factor ISY1
MYRHIDADYYGFRDDEDGILGKLEAQAEKKMRLEVK